MPATAHASIQDSARRTTVRSRLFGQIDVPGDQLYTLPDGLIGFPACQSFALVPAGPPGFTWLQSVDHDTLALLLVDPFPYFPAYAVDLSPQMLARLEARQPGDVGVQAVVTLPASGAGATANLQGPVLLNVKTRTGFQVVLQNTPFGTREPIVLHDQ